MKAKLLGTRQLDFTSKDGNHIKGINLYIAFPEDGVTGHATDKIFIKPDISLPTGIKVNSDIQIFFNRKGKVEAVVNPD